MTVSDMLEPDAGFLMRDTIVFVCEILDCCPGMSFQTLSDGLSGDEEDIFRNLLSRAGFHLTYGDNSSQPQVTLRYKLLMDAGAIAGFPTGLCVYLDNCESEALAASYKDFWEQGRKAK